MTSRRRLIGLVAVPLALAGCASSEATAPSGASTPEQTVTRTTSPRGSDPPAVAQTPCSDAVRGQVQQALGLTSVPTPESVWAEDRYTCTYQTPMGPVIYSVKVEPTPAAAEDLFEDLRTSLRATTPLTRVPQAYQNGRGTVLALHDDLVLSVDASALPPEHLGPDHQSRTGLAIVLAGGVVSGWAGLD